MDTRDIHRAHGTADYIIAANVICHIPDIIDLAQSIELLLSAKGRFIFEEPYLGDIIEKCSYDQIYDEHVFLFSCLSIKRLFNMVGLELIDVWHSPTHGGSMRYTIGRANEYKISENVKHALDKELAMGLNNISTMFKLGERIKKSKILLVNLLENIKLEGKTVCGYAATSKSTTILNYCNIGPELINCIYDSTPIKHGKYSPGMHIPVVSTDKFKKDCPDYSSLFEWNHINEIMAKESDYHNHGGKWITHVPTVQLL